MSLVYILLLVSCFGFLPKHKKTLSNRINSKLIDDYYNFDKPVSYDVLPGLFDAFSINTTKLKSALELNEEPKKVYTNDNFYKDIKEILKSKYGAYTEHEVKDEKKKIKRNKKKEEKEYFRKQMKKINNDKNIKNNDEKPLIFLIDPKQMGLYKAYNKTMAEAKEKRNNPDIDMKPKNNTLPKDFTDDEYYIWF